MTAINSFATNIPDFDIFFDISVLWDTGCLHFLFCSGVLEQDG